MEPILPIRKKAKSGETSGDGVCLLELGRKHFASGRAIDHLLSAVKEDGLPTAISRGTLYRKRKNFCQRSASYGALVCSLVVGNITVAIQNPAAMLDHCTQHCEGFQNLMTNTVARHSTDIPWSIMLYADGVSPADGLSKNDQRKFQAVYWSFREFGHAALGTEEVRACAPRIQEALARSERMFIEYGARMRGTGLVLSCRSAGKRACENRRFGAPHLRDDVHARKTCIRIRSATTLLATNVVELFRT